MKIGIPSEVQIDETRVALTPNVIPLLLKDGHEVMVEAGAGIKAFITDAHYIDAGAQVVADVQALFDQADAIFKVQPLGQNMGVQRREAEMLREGTICIGLLAPVIHIETMELLARRRITSYSLEFIPRISRAQGMDVLTSMATVAGYKAIVLAADRLGKMFPLLMTAAGTVTPATVLVLGAGVAGLQAIATAKRLGAKVEAFDPRPAVREQVQSLGASFLDMELVESMETTGGYASEQSEAFLERERQTIAQHLSRADVVICTAQIFGKRAPVLITTAMVQQMHRGAVLVDLAADQGGNCEVTQPGKEVDHDGVLIIGAGNLPALVPVDASQLYARNLVNLFRYLYPPVGTRPGREDEIVQAVCLTRDGEIVHPVVRTAVESRQGAQT